ncbi:MAG TPA: DUF134 domain-containing protein [Bacteroidales bacterium]|nr:DUF134 domain-containing protein [Bacteroidales bacterium]
MPRPKRIRKMTNPPHFRGYKPIGLSEESTPVILNYEEYEAIRLSDFELYGQVEAAQIMDVSRPTYARIYESARRKVAQAFVLGKVIVFEGGKVYFDSEWYYCHFCGCYFNHPAKDTEVNACALCGSKNIEQNSDSPEQANTEDICTCPKCGKEKEHTSGIPCQKEICPECKCQMVRKGAPHHHRMRNNNCQ